MHIAQGYISSSILHTLPPLSELQYILILDYYFFANHSLDLHISITQQYCTCTSHQTKCKTILSMSKEYHIHLLQKKIEHKHIEHPQNVHKCIMRTAYCSEEQAGRSHFVQMCEQLSTEQANSSLVGHDLRSHPRVKTTSWEPCLFWISWNNLKEMIEMLAASYRRNSYNE